MPAELKKIRGVLRIVVAGTTKIARSSLGHPVDGGRSHCKERPLAVAKRQVKHINEGK